LQPSVLKGTVAKGVLLHETENLDMSVRLGPVPQLKDDINLGYKGTGRKYGVSDNSIRKWIKKYESI
jgi:hypothetical protein